MMTDDLTSALIRSMARGFTVPDLIRATETLRQSGQSSAIESLHSTWIQHNSDNPLLYAVLFNQSVVLSDQGKLEQARACLERAIALNPEFMPAYINLGRIYERTGNAGLAILQWSAALAKMAAVDGSSVAHKATALNQSARALENANQDAAAENLLLQSLELDCQQREVIQHYVALRQRQCEWPVIAPSERVDSLALMRGISPLSIAALTDDPLLQLALASHYNSVDVGTPSGARVAWKGVANTDAPLRIGYLSSDLREHAVGFLMTEVFALHDRSKVEVFAYYCGPQANDSLHEHFKSTADHFIPISNLDDEEAARRIEADGIQILVDLNGYTREARLKLVALRPAPIIVNWLGYPGTMGSPYHHYLIADDWIIPPSHEHYYSEKVLRLPCYQPSSRQRKVALQRPTRSQAGLPEAAVVYCCFNGVHKINRFTFDRWLMILAGVKDSVLWLLSSENATNERLRDYAAERGIARERLVFAEKLANPFHLARYPLADLFLDTTPYGAHTTASDALWAGVPVLTLSGRSFASRVCGSLARSAGLADLVCTTPKEFVSRGIELGNCPQLLASFRERLSRDREHSTLFDMPLLVSRIEDLYRQIWDDHRNRSLPRPELDNLEVCLEIGTAMDHEQIEMQSVDDYAQFWWDRLNQRRQFRAFRLDRRLEKLEPLDRSVPNSVAELEPLEPTAPDSVAEVQKHDRAKSGDITIVEVEPPTKPLAPPNAPLLAIRGCHSRFDQPIG